MHIKMTRLKVLGIFSKLFSVKGQLMGFSWVVLVIIYPMKSKES